MRGPRKVRIFRDPKKSPNWYVEWRDEGGQRHCESCGPGRKEAEERARQIADRLRELRAGAAPACVVGSTASLDAAALPVPHATNGRPVIQVRAVLCSGDVQVPVELVIEVGPELLQALISARTP